MLCEFRGPGITFHGASETRNLAFWWFLSFSHPQCPTSHQSLLNLSWNIFWICLFLPIATITIPVQAAIISYCSQLFPGPFQFCCLSTHRHIQNDFRNANISHFQAYTLAMYGLLTPLIPAPGPVPNTQRCFEVIVDWLTDGIQLLLRGSLTRKAKDLNDSYHFFMWDRTAW